MSLPERLTIDVTVARDYLDPGRDRHSLAVELFARARRGEVELATAPQGYHLDVNRDLAELLRELFEREEIGETAQVARVSEVTYPSPNLFPGRYDERLVEAWDRIAASWPNAPGGADRFHVETHIVEQRDVFITDDKRLLTMCKRLRDEEGFAIVAMGVAEYLAHRRD